MNRYDLSGKRAVVTGAAQGFGRAIVERFLMSGARVALWDVDPEETAKTVRELAGKGELFTQAVDVSRLEQARYTSVQAFAAKVVLLLPIDVVLWSESIAG